MKVIDNQPTYGTEAEANRRVKYLADNHGIWPGIIRCGNRFRLTIDPETAKPRKESELVDVPAEYVEDTDGYAWLPDDIESAA